MLHSTFVHDSFFFVKKISNLIALFVFPIERNSSLSHIPFALKLHDINVTWLHFGFKSSNPLIGQDEKPVETTIKQRIKMYIHNKFGAKFQL